MVFIMGVDTSASKILIILLIVAIVFSSASLYMSFQIHRTFDSGYSLLSSRSFDASGSPSGNMGLIVMPQPSGSS